MSDIQLNLLGIFTPTEMENGSEEDIMLNELVDVRIIMSQALWDNARGYLLISTAGCRICKRAGRA
jgi:hypothetical protein